MLQDFEALTPNLLARTIETVEGGGLIILLLRSLSSLTSLYTMVMVRLSSLHFTFLSPIHTQLSKELDSFDSFFWVHMLSIKNEESLYHLPHAPFVLN